MKTLWLDYQAPPPGRHRPGYAMLALGVVASLVLVALDLQTASEIERREPQIAQLKRALQRSAAAVNQPAALPASAQVLARWEGFFTSLEQAGDDSVTLLSLAPDSKEIAITGEAKDLDSAFDYVKRLQSAPAIADAHLTEYAVDQDQPRHPIRFSVLAQWRGIAAPESVAPSQALLTAPESARAGDRS